MFVDNITLTVKAGNGGNGSAHFLRNGQTAKGGPDGGHGGNGGNIYAKGSHNISDLQEFRYKRVISADHGVDGKGQKMFGKNAEHITLLLPIGTKITDEATGTVLEIENDTDTVLLARGGLGGRGNIAFKSATEQTPTYAEPGQPGQTKQLTLQLRLIADIGLIGLPNAGKSSILAALTHARPAIGAYPFTTLSPVIGMLDTYAIADIPGLIKGASKGKGLGIQFLQHIEKTTILLHCVDISNPSPTETYDTIRNEMKRYNPLLLEKPEIVLLTKTDLATESTIKRIRSVFEKRNCRVYTASVYDAASIDALKSTLLKILTGP